jgi:hypothetical protein
VKNYCGPVYYLALTQIIGHPPIFVTVAWVIVLVRFALELIPDPYARATSARDFASALDIGDDPSAYPLRY